MPGPGSDLRFEQRPNAPGYNFGLARLHHPYTDHEFVFGGKWTCFDRRRRLSAASSEDPDGDVAILPGSHLMRKCGTWFAIGGTNVSVCTARQVPHRVDNRAACGVPILSTRRRDLFSRKVSRATSIPTISSLLTFIPRRIESLYGDVFKPGRLNQVLPASEDARALRAANSLPAGDRHKIEAHLRESRQVCYGRHIG